MKRWTILAMTMILALSVTTVAFADEHDEGETETTELNDKQMQRAANLAEYYAPHLEDGDAEALQEQIVALRTETPKVGWGVMYKLLRLSEYTGDDLDTLIEELRGEGGWGLGKAMKEMREDSEWKESSTSAKNFGQFKKEQRKNKGDD